MSTTDDEVRRLAAAISKNAKKAADEYETVAEGWRIFTDQCLRDAGIELADAGQFEQAWRWMWKSAFFGGNFTQDARRVLTHARGEATVDGLGRPLRPYPTYEGD